MLNQALIYRRFGAPEQALTLEAGEKAARAANSVRVSMLCAPVNASDLIPVSGAYQHRIALPQVAGYEGVGIVTDAPAAYRDLIGQRVLPLRGEGCWQQIVDCPAELAVPVPPEIENTLAARAYINPLAARLMIAHFSPAGKHLLLTAAGSACAMLAGQWALQAGARGVAGICRSPVHHARLAACGIVPLAEHDSDAIRHYAAQSEVVYDATGGALAQRILEMMPASGRFISYGLLSGQPFRPQQGLANVQWFHVRNFFASLSPIQWQQAFRDTWPLLAASPASAVRLFPLARWAEAIAAYHLPGRTFKPLIAFDDVR